MKSEKEKKMMGQTIAFTVLAVLAFVWAGMAVMEYSIYMDNQSISSLVPFFVYMTIANVYAVGNILLFALKE